MMRLGVLVAVGVLASGLGCVAATGEGPSDDEATSSEDEALSKKGGYEGQFNRAGQGHANKCVKLKNGSAPLRHADFSPTGYSISTKTLVASKTSGECPDGYARIDQREILQTDQGRLVFFRGGYGYENGGNVKYGHLWLADVDRHIDEIPSVGNGQPCGASKDPATEGHYRLRVKAIPGEMHYCKTKGDCNSADETISYEGYGDPAFSQGKNPDPNIHYTYLSWSWINVAGGGVVRAVLPDGAAFHRCDVPAVKLASVTEAGKVNGWVKAVYGKTAMGEQWIYGWTVHSHKYGKEPVTMHVEKL